MKIIQRAAAVAAVSVICLSMAACGDTDKGSSAESVAAAASLAAEISSAAESSSVSEAESSSRAEDTESPAEQKESAADESKAETKEEPAENDSAADEGFTLTGTGYTVSFGEGWTDMSDRMDEMGRQAADDAQSRGIDASEFEGMDLAVVYKPNGSQCPVFNVMKPVYDKALQGLNAENLEQMLLLSMEQQERSANGVAFEGKGIAEYNGEKFVELRSEYDNGTSKSIARQFYAVHNCLQYVITFSVPAEMFDELYDETERIMNTFKFTEE